MKNYSKVLIILFLLCSMFPVYCMKKTKNKIAKPNIDQAFSADNKDEQKTKAVLIAIAEIFTELLEKNNKNS